MRLSIRFTTLFFFLTLLPFSLIHAWTGPQGVAFNTAIEWQSPPTGFSPSEPYTPIWHFNNSTFFVWVDQNYRPWVTQVTQGTATTVPLDPGTDYTAQPDAHHRFSLGVDKLGYIHVTGDMHHYINRTTGVINPYPQRYQKQTILYWKSNKPNSVSEGFTFAGGLNSSTAIPGGGWILGRFFADNNGELYYSSHVHAYESSTNKGQMAVGLYRYNTQTSAWTAIGNVANVSQPNIYNQFPVFYWELSGINGWFQNYQASFKFDTNNRLHFSVTSVTNDSASAGNRLIYAYSSDGGTTWKRANGSIIPSLPIRGIDSEASVGDIIIDTGTGSGLGATPGTIIDKYGQPGVGINFQNSPFYIWRSWNGSAWDTHNLQNFSNLPTSGWGSRLNDNNLVFKVAGAAKLLFTQSLHDPSTGYDLLNFKDYSNIDDYGARKFGTIWGIGYDNSTKVQSIVRTSYTKAILPNGWACDDIAETKPAYGGSCGYINSTFVSTNYGKAIGNNSDSFHYIYKPLYGDGTIQARVTVNSANYSQTGVMMRETLEPSAKQVSIYLKPGTQEAILGYRSTAGSGTFEIAAKGAKNPYWVKLVRSSDKFSSYMSSDGLTWTQVGPTTTVPMKTAIYFGFAAAANTNLWYMESATFDKTGTCSEKVKSKNSKYSKA
jgi:regulation of enolase protein 1 (concanavalin A-like superfamily)